MDMGHLSLLFQIHISAGKGEHMTIKFQDSHWNTEGHLLVTILDLKCGVSLDNLEKF